MCCLSYGSCYELISDDTCRLDRTDNADGTARTDFRASTGRNQESRDAMQNMLFVSRYQRILKPTRKQLRSTDSMPLYGNLTGDFSSRVLVSSCPLLPVRQYCESGRLELADLLG